MVGTIVMIPSRENITSGSASEITAILEKYACGLSGRLLLVSNSSPFIYNPEDRNKCMTYRQFHSAKLLLVVDMQVK